MGNGRGGTQRHARRTARAAAWAVIAAAALAAGCASAPEIPRPSIAVRSALHRVAVTVRVESAGRASHAPPAGVLAGMGEGAVMGLRFGAEFTAASASGSSGGSGEGAIVILAIDAAVTAVATVGGTVYGAFASLPKEEVESRMAVLRAERIEAGADLGLAEALRRAIGESGAPVEAVEPDGGPAADATLDVVLREPVILCEQGFTPRAVLRFESEAELRPAGGPPVPLGRFEFVSGWRPFLKWTDAPSPIREELRFGARQVAEAIVDYALRLETRDGR